MLSKEDDVLNGENSMFSNRYIKEVKMESQLNQAKQLLKEAVYVLNQVPNNTARTLEDGSRDHYKLCSKIDEFLKKS